MEVALKRGESSNKTTFQLFYFLIFFGFGSLFPLLSVYLQEDVGLSGTEIGAIMSISPIVMIFVQPVWGMISDYTRKPVAVLVISLLSTALIGFLYSSVHQYGWLLIVAALLAFTQSAIVPISDSITLNYVQKIEGSYGSIRLWGSIGFALAVLIGGWLSDRFSLVAIFYIFAFILLLSAMLAWRLPRESQAMKVEIGRGMVQLFRIPRFVLFLVTTFLVFGPIYANNFYFGVFIKEIGGTLTGIGFAFLLAAGSEAPFMKITDGLIRRYGTVAILIFAATISALRWMFYFFEPSLTLVYMTTIVQGFSVGLFIPAALQYVRELAPDHVRVTAVSLYSAVGNGLGSWFCTFAGGYILDYYHIGYVYLFFSVLTFIGLVILGTMMMKERRNVPDVS
ncbi:MFS transporter [Thermaerobacillus caldiproteolyticus]|uniref:PPP family 3-phenylpropionic acid transporter n=1 Tax=Thermaerobacillus caldiproteolyticus TaxID=247480 RepID=A0A7V9Z4G0_9BACL|nr:major facilitator superfamily domain-containing protein 6 [Anoxybacillus caldiproteolyticus]MBA2873862.1 PPP family 3-phenylpropionic acid transporter [Anoxybacillus caldiproteolyticus]